jgi:nicotinamidase-related amidase
MTQPASGTGDGQVRSLLAVIDMQRVFGEPDSDWFAPRFAEILGPVRQLTEAFAPRVIFTRFIAPRKPAGAWRQYYEQWPFALQPPGARIYELVDEFADQPGPTLDATTFSKWGPELASLLGGGHSAGGDSAGGHSAGGDSAGGDSAGGDSGSPGELVLAGVSTDCCVLSTAVAAADAGVAVRVVANACAGATDESHEQALEILRLYAPLIEVVSLAEILDEVSESGADGGIRAG